MFMITLPGRMLTSEVLDDVLLPLRLHTNTAAVVMALR
jgi:hypothetical protein